MNLVVVLSRQEWMTKNVLSEGTRGDTYSFETYLDGVL